MAKLASTGAFQGGGLALPFVPDNPGLESGEPTRRAPAHKIDCSNHREDTGRNRSCDLRGNQSIRTRVHGPRAERDSRTSVLRLPRGSAARRLDRRRKAIGQDASGRQRKRFTQAGSDAPDRNRAAGHGGDGRGDHGREGLELAPRETRKK
jgi:hypothetical protein